MTSPFLDICFFFFCSCTLYPSARHFLSLVVFILVSYKSILYVHLSLRPQLCFPAIDKQMCRIDIVISLNGRANATPLSKRNKFAFIATITVFPFLLLCFIFYFIYLYCLCHFCPAHRPFGAHLPVYPTVASGGKLSTAPAEANSFQTYGIGLSESLNRIHVCFHLPFDCRFSNDIADWPRSKWTDERNENKQSGEELETMTKTCHWITNCAHESLNPSER